MVEAEIEFTRSDFNQLPEELRVELIDGELLKMAAPTVLHQELAREAFARLVDCIGWDRVLFGPVGSISMRRTFLSRMSLRLARTPAPNAARAA